eukprot:2657816-Amphidinium_carterae.1
MHTYYVAIDEVHTRESMQPLGDCLLSLRGEMKPMSSTDGAAPRRDRGRPAELDLQRPWLHQLGESVAKNKRTARVIEDDTMEGERDEEDDARDEPETTWTDHKAVLEAVQSAKNIYESRKEIRQRMFKVSLLGGRWQVERTGRSVYGLRCDIGKNTTLHLMAVTWHINKSASFEYNVYSEHGARILVD